MDKPDVDYIEGLSPAISIDQKTTSKNPRSTVGTVTEISPLQGTIKVRLAATPEVMPKSYRREEVTILKKKN